MNTEKIKALLRSLLVEASNVMTDKANLFYNGDELVANTPVYTDEELTIKAEDGIYETDTQILTVENGIVSEIKEKETEEETEETVEEETEVDNVKEDIEAIKAEIETLKNTIESILEKVNAPMAEPIVEEFSKIETISTNKWDNYAERIRNIKK